ncbi:MAG: 3-oxoacyl-ACP reductase FabG [Spirochaetes bacterium]|nr:3-oxoacyl-ACP reductase FabG [Spirochaetota bacterium]
MILKGKSAIVTGAANGIGRAIAVGLAEEGAKVVCVDIKPCTETIRSIIDRGLSCYDYPTDISDYEKVKKMVSFAVNELQHIDILVNNAGIISRKNFTDLESDEWHKILSVNLHGTFYCCKEVVPKMIEQKSGKIINITSVAGVIGDITASPVYGTSKGAINTLTKSLARQLACFGINVNAVAPHAIETDMSRQWSKEKREEVVRSIPLGRLGQPEEVSHAVVFLASSHADYITGEVLNLNGGFLMH